MAYRISITERKYRSGVKTFIARFFDGSTLIRTVVLPEAHTVRQATLMAKDKLDKGVVAKQDDPFVVDFLKEFWTANSMYVRERAREGVVLSERYIEDSLRIALARFGAVMKGKRMSQIEPILITRALDQMEKDTKKGSGFRSAAIAMQTLTVPVRWYCRMHRVENPLAYVKKIRSVPKQRGTLSALEVGKIIDIEGESPRAKAAVLLAALCGLRLGEVRGLQWSDIDSKNGTITICHNAPTGSDTVKAPKCGSERVVPMSKVVKDALELIKKMPDYSKTFVVYNERRANAPIEEVTITRGFHRILTTIGISQEERVSRNLVFHGLRHTFVSLSRAAGVPDFVVQRLAGHKGAAMMELYSHADKVIDFAAASAGMTKILDDAKVSAQKTVGEK